MPTLALGPPIVLWTIAGVAAVIGLALVVVLVRRSTVRNRWKIPDYLAAIGIAASLFASATTAIAAHAASPIDPPDVVAYRQRVRSTCASIRALADISGFLPPDALDHIARQDLLDALNGQIDAYLALMDVQWEGPVPKQLVAAADDAKQKGNIWLYLARENVKVVTPELPRTMSEADEQRFLHDLGVRNNPNLSAFLGAMSALGNERCAQ